MVDVRTRFGDATMEAWRRQFVEWELGDPVHPEDDEKFLKKLELFFSEELQGQCLDLETVAYWREVYGDEVARRKEGERVERRISRISILSFFGSYVFLKSLLFILNKVDPTTGASAVLDLLFFVVSLAAYGIVRQSMRRRWKQVLSEI